MTAEAIHFPSALIEGLVMRVRLYGPSACHLLLGIRHGSRACRPERRHLRPAPPDRQAATDPDTPGRRRKLPRSPTRPDRPGLRETLAARRSGDSWSPSSTAWPALFPTPATLSRSSLPANLIPPEHGRRTLPDWGW